MMTATKRLPRYKHGQRRQPDGGEPLLTPASEWTSLRVAVIEMMNGVNRGGTPKPETRTEEFNAADGVSSTRFEPGETFGSLCSPKSKGTTLRVSSAGGCETRNLDIISVFAPSQTMKCLMNPIKERILEKSSVVALRSSLKRFELRSREEGLCYSRKKKSETTETLLLKVRLNFRGVCSSRALSSLGGDRQARSCWFP